MNFLEYIHPETNPPKDAIALVIPIIPSEQPKVMVAKRLSGYRPRRGELTFPGGGIKYGETPEEAAVREGEEETGIVFPKSGLIPAQHNPSIERWGGGFHYVYMYYAFAEADRFQKREKKLGKWSAITVEQLEQYVRDLQILPFVLNGWWRERLTVDEHDKMQ